MNTIDECLINDITKRNSIFYNELKKSMKTSGSENDALSFSNRIGIFALTFVPSNLCLSINKSATIPTLKWKRMNEIH